MHLRSLIGSVVALGSVIGPTAVSATALTTIVGAQETSCFYLHTHAIGEKIGVYFAVQSGGAFDIDWLVRDDHDKVIMKGTKDKQGDYIFTAQRGGEYSLCFSNDMSTFAEKLVDFDFMLGTEEGHAPPNLKPGAIADKTTRLEDSIARLSASLDDITRHQKYFRTRENRNVATVQSTQSRIFWYSLLQCAVFLGLSWAQMNVVKLWWKR